MKKSSNSKSAFCFIALFFCANIFVIGQDIVAEPVFTSVGSTERKNSDKEEEKGSTVRGRVTYRDSGAPVRRGWIAFRKIKELVEPPKTESKGEVFVGSSTSYGTDNYVLTNDLGEFEMKNVKAGIYQPVLKVMGVLNPEFSDRDNPLFQQIAVDGVSEIQTLIGIVRGAAVSGRILYADGSPVIGARVQVLDKESRVFRYYEYSENLTTTTTDDLGFYRLSGLPEGDYIVRVVEPSLPARSVKSVSSYDLSRTAYSSEHKTYYPNADSQKEAVPVQLLLGQEQTGINISIPDRRSLTISGSVVAKSDKKPVGNATVSFSKNNEEDFVLEYDGGQNRQLKTDETGIWKFEDLPEGKYLVRASVNGEYEYENGKAVLKKPSVRYAPQAVEIDLEENDAENILIELSVEATIAGFVSVEDGKEIPNRVYISAVSRDFRNSAGEGVEKSNKQSDKRRLPFLISAVSEGEFYLTGSATEDYYVKSIRLGSKDLLNETLKIEAGEKIENVEVVLSDKIGTVKGKVSGLEKGERAFVVIFPAGKKGVAAFASARQGAVNDKGEFTLTAAPGDYIIFVGTAKNRPKIGKFDEWLEEIRTKSEKITVRLNETANVSLTYADK